MLKVGLTGGIGSGKTTVAKIFESLGIPVYYADNATKHLMNNDPDLKSAIMHHFGPQAYSAEGLDRKWMASIVFNNPEKLKLLNELTHPVTIKEARNWMEAQITPYIIKEAALLFESGADKDLDCVIGVAAPLSLRVNRAMERDHLTEAEVMKRIRRQMNEEEKLKRCDFIVTNNEEQLLIPQVLALHEKFQRGEMS